MTLYSYMFQVSVSFTSQKVLSQRQNNTSRLFLQYSNEQMNMNAIPLFRSDKRMTISISVSPCSYHAPLTEESTGLIAANDEEV